MSVTETDEATIISTPPSTMGEISRAVALVIGAGGALSLFLLEVAVNGWPRSVQAIENGTDGKSLVAVLLLIALIVGTLAAIGYAAGKLFRSTERVTFDHSKDGWVTWVQRYRGGGHEKQRWPRSQARSLVIFQHRTNDYPRVTLRLAVRYSQIEIASGLRDEISRLADRLAAQTGLEIVSS